MSNNQYTATSVRKLVDKFFSLQWCRDNLVVPLYIETSLPLTPEVLKIAIANYSYLGTIAEPIKQRINQSGWNLKCEFVERSQEEIQEILEIREMQNRKTLKKERDSRDSRDLYSFQQTSEVSWAGGWAIHRCL